MKIGFYQPYFLFLFFLVGAHVEAHGADLPVAANAHQNAPEGKGVEMLGSQFPELYDSYQMDKIPCRVPMAPEASAYLKEITQSILRVVTKTSTLEQEEAGILGVGEYHHPKMKKPITIRSRYKLRMRNLRVVFERKNENSVWFDVVMFLAPRNYPYGVYFADLPAGFFKEFTLEKAFAEDRPEESVKRVNVFHFRLKNTPLNIHLQFEAREDVSSLKDKYPKSFHVLKITRVDE